MYILSFQETEVQLQIYITDKVTVCFGILDIPHRYNCYRNQSVTLIYGLQLSLSLCLSVNMCVRVCLCHDQIAMHHYV